KEEIKLLLRYTMHKVAKHYGLPPRDITQSALDACQNHSWPGNLKELETFVKRYLVAGDQEFSVNSWELPNTRREGSRVRSESETDDIGPRPRTLKSMIQSV